MQLYARFKWWVNHKNVRRNRFWKRSVCAYRCFSLCRWSSCCPSTEATVQYLWADRVPGWQPEPHGGFRGDRTAGAHWRKLPLLCRSHRPRIPHTATDQQHTPSDRWADTHTFTFTWTLNFKLSAEYDKWSSFFQTMSTSHLGEGRAAIVSKWCLSPSSLGCRAAATLLCHKAPSVARPHLVTLS